MPIPTGLRLPQFIQSESFSALRSRLLTRIRSGVPTAFLAPASVGDDMVDAMALDLYDERLYANARGRSFSVLYAMDADLDHNAALFGLERTEEEGNETFRNRVVSTPASVAPTTQAGFPAKIRNAFPDRIFSFDYVAVPTQSLVTGYVVATGDGETTQTSDPPGTPTTEFQAEVLQTMRSVGIADLLTSYAIAAVTFRRVYLAVAINYDQQVTDEATFETDALAALEALFQSRRALDTAPHVSEVYTALDGVRGYISANVTRFTTNAGNIGEVLPNIPASKTVSHYAELADSDLTLTGV